MSTNTTTDGDTSPSTGGAPTTANDALLQKDYSKLRNFFIQAVCGPYMAIYRSTGHAPSSPQDAMMLKYYLGKYLNDIHYEVVTGVENDEYIRTVFEDCMSHHSINCISHVILQLGCSMIDLLVQVHLGSSNSNNPQNISVERIDAVRNLISGLLELWAPNFSEIFDHACSGQSIAELKEEVRNGSYVPPFSFHTTPAQDSPSS